MEDLTLVEKPRDMFQFAPLQAPQIKNIIRDVEIWCANPVTLKYARCAGFLDSVAEVGIANARLYKQLMINSRPLNKPACLRLLNGIRIPTLHEADMVIKLRKKSREYDLKRVNLKVINQEGWADVVIGEDTHHNLILTPIGRF